MNFIINVKISLLLSHLKMKGDQAFAAPKQWNARWTLLNLDRSLMVLGS